MTKAYKNGKPLPRHTVKDNSFPYMQWRILFTDAQAQYLIDFELDEEIIKEVSSRLPALVGYVRCELGVTDEIWAGLSKND